MVTPRCRKIINTTAQYYEDDLDVFIEFNAANTGREEISRGAVLVDAALPFYRHSRRASTSAASATG